MEAVIGQARIQTIQDTLASIFAAQDILRVLAPEYKWAGLGNLLGDFGECVAIEHYGWIKAPSGANGYDAITQDGKKVQVKANHAANSIGFRGDADLLLVIQVATDGSWSILYFGDFAAVKAVATTSTRDNKFMVTITKLKALQSTHELVRELAEGR